MIERSILALLLVGLPDQRDRSRESLHARYPQEREEKQKSVMAEFQRPRERTADS